MAPNKVSPKKYNASKTLWTWHKSARAQVLFLLKKEQVKAKSRLTAEIATHDPSTSSHLPMEDRAVKMVREAAEIYLDEIMQDFTVMDYIP